MQATVSNFDVYEQIDCKIYSDKLSRDGHDGSDQKLPKKKLNTLQINKNKKK